MGTDMKSYVKRPLMVQAHRLAAEDFDSDHPNDDLVPGVTYNPIERYATIHTLEGVMRVEIGDWIVKGIHGELYPVKNEIFVDSYDLAPETDPIS